jgi:Zn-dependent metalloprotease
MIKNTIVHRYRLPVVLFIALIIVGQLSLTFAIRSPADNIGPQCFNTNNEREQPSMISLLRHVRKITLNDIRDNKDKSTAGAIEFSGNAEDTIKSIFEKKFKNTPIELLITKSETDRFGIKHIRCTQTYKGHPIIGTDFILHINKDNKLIETSGTFVTEIVITNRIQISIDEAHQFALKCYTKDVSVVDGSTKLCVFNTSIAYQILLVATGEIPGKWKSFIDASTGEELYRQSLIRFAFPDPQGEYVTMTGNRMTPEDGAVVNVTAWRDRFNIHFLYSPAGYWGIFNKHPNVEEWVQQVASPAFGTTDPVAFSAARNIDTIQKWCQTVLNRRSYDNRGTLAIINIHDTRRINQSYWDGIQFHFGESDGITTYGTTTLDIIGHEFGHALDEFTSRLDLNGESGALVESYGDIVGTAVEFYGQSDGRSAYPNYISGRADWLIGEDVFINGDALRDLRDPQRYNQPSFYKGSKWYFGTLDNGGIHTNGGVQNFAFYLLSEGGSGSNDGRPYNVTGIGITAATDIVTYAYTYILTTIASYADARAAWISAAQHFGYNTQSVMDAWSAVGVYPQERRLSVSQSSVNFGAAGINVADTFWVTLYNAGTQTTSLNSYTSTNPVFSVEPVSAIQIPSATFVPLRIIFRPTGTAAQHGIITLTSNAINNPQLLIAVQGSGTQPSGISVNPSSISRTINSGESFTATVTVQNTGTAPLQIRANGVCDLYSQSNALGKVAPPGFSKVLFISDTFSNARQFISAIQNLNNVASLDTFNGHRATPTLNYLRQFDAVIVAKYKNNSWADSLAIGNILADYIDAGGHICLMGGSLYNAPGYNMSGRIATSDYSPLAPGERIFVASTPSDTWLRNAITRNITSINAEVLFIGNVQGNGVSLGKYRFEGFEIGAYNPLKPIVTFNIHPYDNVWNGDVPQLISNSLDWFRFNFAYTLTQENQLITIPSGSSSQLSLTVNSTDLQCDSYSGSIRIDHNDPAITDPLLIPVNFVINGVRHLSATPLSLIFAATSSESQSSVLFTNNSSSPVTIQAITSSNTAFSSVLSVPLRIGSYSSCVIPFRFNPVSAGLISGTLTITSNANDNPMLTIAVSGTGLTPPIALLTPLTLQHTLTPASNPVNTNVTLSNNGGDVLSYAVTSIRQTLQPTELDSEDQLSAGADINYTLAQASLNDIPDNCNKGAILVVFRPGTQAGLSGSIGQSITITSIENLSRPSTTATAQATNGSAIYLYKIDQQDEQSILNAVDQLRSNPDVLWAEPDYPVTFSQPSILTNDPAFRYQWALLNNGQSGGTPGCDIKAVSAWTIESGSRYPLIAVISSGVDYTHPDLSANIWINPGEIANNGIDDDRNGYVDDIRGWNCTNWNNDPMDTKGLGTHMAGVIAAVGNNRDDFSGIMWQSSIVPVRCANDAANGYSSTIIRGINYALAAGARIIVHDWESYNYSVAVSMAFAQGGLHIVGSGDHNSNMDNNGIRSYPASYTFQNIIAVTSTDHNDRLCVNANIGILTVDLGAPGYNIYSLDINNSKTQRSGSLAAAPFVAGVAGLLMSRNVHLTNAQVKQILLSSVDRIPALANRCVSQGRLNAYKALNATPLPWFSIRPQVAGTVNSMGNQVFNVTVNPRRLIQGNWRSECIVTTNDPSRSQITLTTNVTVNSLRSINCNNRAINFGNIQDSTNSNTATVYLINDGNSPTTINSFTNNNTAFTVITTFPSTIPAFDSIPLVVRYNPANQGTHIGDMRLYSNAENYQVLGFSLNGRNLPVANISVDKSSIIHTIPFGTLLFDTLILSNTGGEGLDILSYPKHQTFTVSPYRGTVPAYGTQRVNINFNSANLPIGVYDDTITIEHDLPNSSDIKIPVTLRIEGLVSVTPAPSHFNFGRRSSIPDNTLFSANPVPANLASLKFVTTTDLDYDNHTDILALSDGADGQLYRFMGNSSNSYTQHVVGPVNFGNCIDVGTLNGSMDIVAGSRRSPYLVWFDNIGACEALVPHSIPMEYPVRYVKVVSVNGDYANDIVYSAVGNLNQGILGWLENKGELGFDNHIITSNFDVLGVANVADINNDGHMDIISASGIGDRISWFENNSTGQFTEHIVAESCENATDISAADMDQDGDMDIVIVSNQSSDVVAYINDGSYTFTARPIAAEFNPTNMKIADLDLDGRNDIIISSHYEVGNLVGGKIIWFKNTGNFTFGQYTLSEINDGPGFINLTIADVNSDKDLDIITARRSSGSLLTILRNDFNPPFQRLRLTNTTNSIIELNAPQFTNSAFSIDAVFPRMLLSRDFIDIDIMYKPQSTGIHDGLLTFNTTPLITPPISVTLHGSNVPANSPAFQLNHLSINKTVFQGNQIRDTLVISNPGGQNLSYTIANTASWITLSRTVGVVTPGNRAEIIVTMNSATLHGGPNITSLRFNHIDPGTISPLMLPCTLNVALPQLSILASATSGGTITPTGNILVPNGNNATFTFTALPGYSLSKVLVDNVSIGIPPTHTFNSVTSNHTIHAEFLPITPRRSHIVSAGSSSTASSRGAQIQLRNVIIGSPITGQSSGTRIRARFR